MSTLQNIIRPQLETEELVKEVYDELLTSLCIEIAYGVHRMAKTGVMKLSDIMIPRAGRDSPSLSSTATEIEGEKKMADFNGLQCLDELPPTKRQRCTNLVSHKTQERSQHHTLETGTATLPTPMVTRNASNNSVVDIWGRILPKEPKRTVKCPHCGKGVSALRFAMHLDKCLIGNTRTTK